MILMSSPFLYVQANTHVRKLYHDHRPDSMCQEMTPVSSGSHLTAPARVILRRLLDG